MTDSDRPPAGEERPITPVAGLPDARLGPAPPPSRLPRAMSAFSHHNFRMFWGGQLVSLIGTWMQQVAQVWLVLVLTNDPLALGLVAAAQFGPVLLIGLFAGIAADALPKRAALMWTAVSAAVLALVLGVLVAAALVQVWHVYLLAVLLGVVNAFEMPIRQAFVVEMVGRRDVTNAVALNSAVFNGSRIIGPAVAGLVIATIGMAPLFFLNAVSYLAVVAGLLAMRPHELLDVQRAAVERTVRSVVGRLVEGLRYVRRQEVILLSISVLGVVSTFALNFQVLVPVLARDVLAGDADTFGFLMAASGAGSLLSALSIAFGQRPTMQLLLTGTLAIGLSMIGLGVTAFLPLSLVLMFVAGWGVIAMAATINTYIQLNVPDVLRGRVMSVYMVVFAGSVPIGGLFAGVVAAGWGVQAALAVGGALALLTTVVAALRLGAGRRVRELAVTARGRASRRH